MNRIWLSGKWPDAWQEGVILPLFKGGNGAKRTDPNDYRPITLTNSLAKLMEMLMLGRLNPFIESKCLLVEEQGGFRAGRSTLDQIFTLLEVIASRREGKNLPGVPGRTTRLRPGVAGWASLPASASWSHWPDV